MEGFTAQLNSFCEAPAGDIKDEKRSHKRHDVLSSISQKTLKTYSNVTLNYECDLTNICLHPINTSTVESVVRSPSKASTAQKAWREGKT